MGNVSKLREGSRLHTATPETAVQPEKSHGLMTPEVKNGHASEAGSAGVHGQSRYVYRARLLKLWKARPNGHILHGHAYTLK